MSRMSKQIKARAEQSRQMVEEVTALELPEPSPAEIAHDERALSEEIQALMQEIDLENTGSILGFGAGAQGGLQEISQSMLADVRNKDVGPAGESLREMVSAIRGFSASELDLRRDRSLWERLSGRAAPIARFTAKFDQVQDQIDRITDELLRHEHQLLKDIKALDVLYEQTLEFYDSLALYIAAGAARLRQIDRDEMPERTRALDAAPEDQQPLRAQELHDLQAARADLERRVHDMRLTRQVTMQSLPSIRLVQENDKSLVARINSTLVNTVPLWESQLAQTITLQRSTEAAQAVRDASDLTNELLTSNAKALRQNTRMVREEVERGVFDIEAVKAANAELIGSIEESLSLAEQGSARRHAAEQDLQTMQSELRDALSSARTRGRDLGRPAPGQAPKRP